MSDAAFRDHAGAGDGATQEQTIGGGFGALLAELAHLLERFADSGERGAVDLRSLPMAAGEYDRLRELLGRGEATVTLDVSGQTTIYETDFHGLWWVRHCTPDGETAAQYLEVSAVPDIVLADAADARRDAERLRARIPQRNASLHERGVADEQIQDRGDGK
ncbi:MAG TPA: hydrogenase expression/formation C-terminal domain-containing protein [Gammaproteobacteria bacterium]|nr:hydrogenase expression/formation C-terminal domain-containing protein [Gammaproteobacteria bacterium]